MLPKVTEKERKEKLRTPPGAIQYIGAIMFALAEEAEKPHAAGWPGENIRNRPEILTNAYQGEDLDTWRAHLDTKKPGDTLEPGNDMALWVGARSTDFLERAVGAPADFKSSGQSDRTLPILRRGDRNEDVRLLQRNLNAANLAPMRPLPENGSFGPTTELHVREFQRRHGLKDDGIVGPQTWATLGGAIAPPKEKQASGGNVGSLSSVDWGFVATKEGRQRTTGYVPNAAGSKSGVTPKVVFGASANRDAVSDFSLTVLEDILRAAGLPSAIITSTARTVDAQVEAMFNNIKNKGAKSQKKLYGPSGDQVIDAYVKAKSEKKPDAAVKAAMKLKIQELGPSKVSKHLADPVKMNVVDIAPTSITNRKAFEQAVRADQRISKFLTPPEDPAYHLEIPQPQKSTNGS